MEPRPMKTLRVTREEAVLRVVLNRPDQRNAMTLQMFDELREVFEGVAGDRSVRVVSLSGAEGNFCSGGDLTPDDIQNPRTRPHVPPPSPSSSATKGKGLPLAVLLGISVPRKNQAAGSLPFGDGRVRNLPHSDVLIRIDL